MPIKGVRAGVNMSVFFLLGVFASINILQNVTCEVHNNVDDMIFFFLGAAHLCCLK